MADIISTRITSSHYESHYAVQEITWVFLGDMESDSQRSDGISLLSVPRSVICPAGTWGLLPQWLGQWGQDPCPGYPLENRVSWGGGVS